MLTSQFLKLSLFRLVGRSRRWQPLSTRVRHVKFAYVCGRSLSTASSDTTFGWNTFMGPYFSFESKMPSDPSKEIHTEELRILPPVPHRYLSWHFNRIHEKQTPPQINSKWARNKPFQLHGFRCIVFIWRLAVSCLKLHWTRLWGRTFAQRFKLHLLTFENVVL